MPDRTARTLRVFLCHASDDKPVVYKLHHMLSEAGFDVWLDEENLLPGQDWKLEIPRAVRSADAVVICLSKRAVTKEGYVQKEITFALDVADEKPERTIYLIPLRLEDCTVPDRLCRWQWVDLFKKNGYKKLLKSLNLRAQSLGLEPQLSDETIHSLASLATGIPTEDNTQLLTEAFNLTKNISLKSQASEDKIRSSIIPTLATVAGGAFYSWETGREFQFVEASKVSDRQRLELDRTFQRKEFPLLDAVRDHQQMVVGIPNPQSDWIHAEILHEESQIINALGSDKYLVIGLPLAIDDDFYGVVLLEEDLPSRPSLTNRLNKMVLLVRDTAARLSAARSRLETADRIGLEREIQIAHQIQLTGMPGKLPTIPGWEMASTWQPARQIGGDFYDAVELADGRIGLLIGDVTDKGMPAALFITLARTLFRASVHDLQSPAEVLRRVNMLILPESNQGMFLTAVYAVLTPAKNELVYANAGHNPPFLLHYQEGKIEALKRTGMALGIIDDFPLEERTITFQPKDMILLYTDGVTEEFSQDGDFFGEERLQKLIISQKDQPVSAMLSNISDTVRLFMQPALLQDDHTMLALRRLE